MGSCRLVLRQHSNLQEREHLSYFKIYESQGRATLYHMTSIQAQALRLGSVVLAWAPLPVAGVGVDRLLEAWKDVSSYCPRVS